MKTSEAATALNVSATTLRAWEVRYGFPVPARTIGRHRIYERDEILALRRALDEGLSVASAVEKVRANLGIDDAQLESALRSFDSHSADQAMEAALAVRRLDRCIEEVLLRAVAATLRRGGRRSAAWAFAARWSVDWLRRQGRLGLLSTVPVSVLIGDATCGELDPDRVALAALELFCARGGMRVLTLPVSSLGGLADAAQGVDVVVVAGSEADEEDVRRWLGTVRVAAGPVPLLFFRTAGRTQSVIGPAPQDAQRTLLSLARLPSRALQPRRTRRGPVAV